MLYLIGGAIGLYILVVVLRTSAQRRSMRLAIHGASQMDHDLMRMEAEDTLRRTKRLIESRLAQREDIKVGEKAGDVLAWLDEAKHGGGERYRMKRRSEIFKTYLDF